MPPTACPGPAPLRQLLQGQAAAADAARLEQHLIGCPQCLRQLAELAGKREPVAAPSGQVATTRAAHPVLARLREKAAALRIAAVPSSLVNTGTGFATGAEAPPVPESVDETSRCRGRRRVPVKLAASAATGSSASLAPAAWAPCTRRRTRPFAAASP